MFFVYRSHYDGPLSKHVRRVPDDTVVGWFRRGWDADDPEEWTAGELGAEPYGLTSIFETDAGPPDSTARLRELLHEHLYVEGPADYIRLDDHSLRVRTDDDEVELAYFFFDDTAVATSADRLAYLLHPGWPLPHDTGPPGGSDPGGSDPGGFEPGVPVRVVGPPGAAGSTTYVVFLTYYDGASLARNPPLAFPGVPLSGLVEHLRQLTPGDWPPELLVLRALAAPNGGSGPAATPDGGLRAALERCNRWPGFDLNADPWPGFADDDAAVAALDATVEGAAESAVDDRDPGRSLLRVNEHLAQLAMHCGASFGYQQWFLFDTAWAGAHPDLARSLLRYAHHWDPLAGEIAPKTGKGGAWR